MTTVNGAAIPTGLERAHALDPAYYFGEATFALERLRAVYTASP